MENVVIANHAFSCSACSFRKNGSAGQEQMLPRRPRLVFQLLCDERYFQTYLIKRPPPSISHLFLLAGRLCCIIEKAALENG